MPNLRLADDEIADLVAYLISRPRSAEFKASHAPKADPGERDALVYEYLDADALRRGREGGPREDVRAGQGPLRRREDHRPLRLLRLPHHPRVREGQAHRRRALRVGEQAGPPPRLRIRPPPPHARRLARAEGGRAAQLRPREGEDVPGEAARCPSSRSRPPRSRPSSRRSSGCRRTTWPTRSSPEGGRGRAAPSRPGGAS